ncbi:GntR family transcriptional regulator [Legionella steigerwaltii]|uniref:GntR family transcriptional regulator n=1 Tax=Legionella steigerwaltii TaxID=460 RepID=A0A378L754_9GAMM|nr:GntR family transcriptional regulator [Legionella steigerwaltii]KTD69925.1 HTH-type transcriptional repressor CsiR [Legionella steigerwaltii]STY21762.1 GntR family transcriptional regulator [Legionella steigerwaltii]
MSQMKTKQSKASSVLEKLRRDLVSGFFDPGQKLQMEHLKERYEVGYSPLREALSRLVSQGLVNLEDLCGFSVPSLSLEELYDLYAVRIQIETHALELSMQYGDVYWEADVIACWHRYAKYLTPQPNNPLDPVEWDAFQKEFTFTLIKACQSPWLLKIQEMLYDHSSRYRFLCLGRHHHDEKVLAELRQENEDLVTAVLARDKEKAIQISQVGWDTSIKIMAESLKNKKN